MDITVKVRALAFGGDLIGEVVTGPAPLIGKRALVPFVAPDELVRIKILKEDTRIIFGALEEILEVSPHRVSPSCPYFQQCGGCHLQHLPIDQQRELKRSMVEQTLKKHGGVVPLGGVKLAGAELPAFSYRRRITLHLNESGELGFYRPRSGVVVPILHCAIASPALNEVITVLIEAAKELTGLFSGIVVEEHEHGETSTLLMPSGTHHRPEIPQVLRDRLPRIAVSHRTGVDDDEDGDTIGHFSQVNKVANEALVRLVLERISKSVVTDLYAGSGNFSIPLAQSGKRVTAVELDRALVKAGNEEAKKLKLSARLTFSNSSCEKFIKNNALADAVVLDPPRSGAKILVEHLRPKRTQEIVYVSCNLPSLTRDLKILQSSGYTIIETIVVDMFPQTHHVETVTLVTSNEHHRFSKDL